MRGRQLQSRYGRTAPFVWRHGLIWLKKIAMDRTQTGSAGLWFSPSPAFFTSVGVEISLDSTEKFVLTSCLFLCALVVCVRLLFLG